MGLLFLRHLNTAAPEMPTHARSIIIQALERLDSDSALLPSRNDAMKFQALFHDSNAQFYRMIGGAFSPFSDNFDRFPMERPTMELSATDYALLTPIILSKVAENSSYILARNHFFRAREALLNNESFHAERLAETGQRVMQLPELKQLLTEIAAQRAKEQLTG